MTFFFWLVGGPHPFDAVMETNIGFADHVIGNDNPAAKVFYTDSCRHTHTNESLEKVVSEGGMTWGLGLPP